MTLLNNSMTNRYRIAFTGCILIAVVPSISNPASTYADPPASQPNVLIADTPHFSPDGKYVALRTIALKVPFPKMPESAWELPRLRMFDAHTWKEQKRPADNTWDVSNNDGAWSENGNLFILRPIDPPRPFLQWGWRVSKGTWVRPHTVKLAPQHVSGGHWEDWLPNGFTALWRGSKKGWEFKRPRLTQKTTQVGDERVGPVRLLVKSPDGNRCACVVGGQGSGPGQCISAPSTLALLATDQSGALSLGEVAPLTRVAWSRDGCTLLFNGKQGVTLYYLETGKHERVGNESGISKACFHPVTGMIWGVKDRVHLVERVDGKWMIRFTIRN